MKKKTEKHKELLRKLNKLFPRPRIALNYSNEWEKLVAVILSAQCTDKKVNEVTEKLFKKYKTIGDYLNADIKKFEQDVRQTGFYRNKAKNILKAAELTKGKIPKTMDEMLLIPGVARKTANVMLGNKYGIAVDTHVKRFANRFGLSKSQNPVIIERDLMEIVPKKDWPLFTLRVIEYGRTHGPAKKYDKSKDPLI